MRLFWILAYCLWVVNSIRFALSMPPLASAPGACNMATCSNTPAMSLFAALAMAPISPQLGPIRPVLALM